MLVTQEVANTYKLNKKLVGGNLRWANVKMGGEFVCPSCKVDGDNKLVVSTPEEMVNCGAPNCPKCGKKCVLRGAVPTGEVVASVLLVDGTRAGTIVRKNPKDKDDKQMFMKVMLGRINKAVEMHVGMYIPRTRAQRAANKEIGQLKNETK